MSKPLWSTQGYLAKGMLTLVLGVGDLRSGRFSHRSTAPSSPPVRSPSRRDVRSFSTRTAVWLRRCMFAKATR